MYRAILTIIVVAAFMATTCYGDLEVIPAQNCTEDKVGLTFFLDPALYNTSSPEYYCICRDATTPMIFPCVEGSGYINNGTIEGCVPWVLWDCTSKAGAPACTAEQQGSRFPASSPTLTWICQGINDPQIVACPEGTAYVPSGSDLGCKPWAEWLTYCPW